MDEREFVSWLRSFLPMLNSGPVELQLIAKRLNEVNVSTPTPFCGGKWDTMHFDYYWIPNDHDSE